VDAVIDKAAALPGRVLSVPCDVTDEGAMARTAAAIEDRAGREAICSGDFETVFPRRLAWVA